jgi:hypothetical protein
MVGWARMPEHNQPARGLPMTSWRDILPIHPAAELFPLMEPDELRELGEDIKNGLQSPIILWTDADHPGYSLADSNKKVKASSYDWQVIDGRNRLDAMELVGIPVPKPTGDVRNDSAPYYTLVEPYQFAFARFNSYAPDPHVYVISANAHRRHLTPDQKREVIAALLKANPSQSDRSIAKTVKVDNKTVGAKRTQMEATGEIPQLEKRTGKDGKARKPPRPKAKTATDIAVDSAKKALADPMASADARKNAAEIIEQHTNTKPAPTCQTIHLETLEVPEHLRPAWIALSQVKAQYDREFIAAWISCNWREAAGAAEPSAPANAVDDADSPKRLLNFICFARRLLLEEDGDSNRSRPVYFAWLEEHIDKIRQADIDRMIESAHKEAAAAKQFADKLSEISSKRSQLAAAAE